MAMGRFELKGDTGAVNRKQKGGKRRQMTVRELKKLLALNDDGRRRATTEIKLTALKGPHRDAKDDWKTLNGNWEMLKGNRESHKRATGGL